MNKNWKYYCKDGSVLKSPPYLSTILHRENAPAIESPGHSATHWEFVYNGFLHNLKGPAVCFADGSLKYYIDGYYIGTNLSNKEFQQKIKEMVFK